MKRFLAIGVCLLSTISIVQAADDAEPATAKTEMKSLRDKASYSIGLSIGRNMKSQSFNLDIAKLAAGIADGMAGKQQLEDERIQEVMQEFEKAHSANQVTKLKAAAETNKKEGDAFLVGNKKKQGVVTTKSGLQYEIINAGKGAKPTKADTVTTHYEGTLIDGTVFDSSKKRGQPATFPVGGVIPGWTEALQLMPIGSKWRLYVPSELAYGPQGAGPDIGPNATLIFEVELLDIGEPKTPEGDAEEISN